MVGLVTSTMALHGIAGIKGVVGLGSRAALSLVKQLRGSFSYPLTVHTDSGSSFTLDVVRLANYLLSRLYFECTNRSKMSLSAAACHCRRCPAHAGMLCMPHPGRHVPTDIPFKRIECTCICLP